MGNTLGEHLRMNEAALRETEQELAPYIFIKEVADFIKWKKEDLRKFKLLVDNFSADASIFEVQAFLRDMPGVKSKFYGGICSGKGEYFKVTKKLRKMIDEEIARLRREADEEERPKGVINFDKDYAIPDELTSEIAQQMFEDF